MLNIKQQKVVAQEQNYRFDELHITGGALKDSGLPGGLSAVVTFVIENEKGERIGVERLEYAGEDYNQFWADFNSGKFLYEELAAKKELDVTVSEAVEAEFTNEITKADNEITL